MAALDALLLKHKPAAQRKVAAKRKPVAQRKASAQSVEITKKRSRCDEEVQSDSSDSAADDASVTSLGLLWWLSPHLARPPALCLRRLRRERLDTKPACSGSTRHQRTFRVAGHVDLASEDDSSE